MPKDISENKQEVLKDDPEEHLEQQKENKEWKDIINLPDDLDHEVH